MSFSAAGQAGPPIPEPATLVLLAGAVPLLLPLLRDRAKRLRRRLARALLPVAAELPVETIEKACRAETCDDVREHLARFLQKATQEQDKDRHSD